MPVYVLYGFQWPRFFSPKAPGIRVYIILNDLLEATAEYLMQEDSHRVVIDSFKKIDPNIHSRLPGLRLIEQYDPEDLTLDAVSKPYAFVGAKVMTLGEGTKPTPQLSFNMHEMVSKDPELSEEAMESFKKLRDTLAPEAPLGWWVVYNGGPERPFTPDPDDFSDGESYEMESGRFSRDSKNSYDGHGEPKSSWASRKLKNKFFKAK